MFGMGLRHSHFPEILSRLEEKSSSLEVDFFEIITENFFATEGHPLKVLEKIRENYPISFHGVSLSIASAEDLNMDYLNSVKKLAERIDPFQISDHLCWTGLAHSNTHNLLPIPYNKELLVLIADKVNKVQDVLGRPLLLENLSAYFSVTHSEFTEAQFLVELHKKTGCFLLLDLNNLYVNSRNHHLNIDDWLEVIPSHIVKEIHLAGFTDMGSYYFDTHSCPVWDEVWKIYQLYKIKYQNAVTLIEWDEDIPNYSTVLNEVNKAKVYGFKKMAE